MLDGTVLISDYWNLRVQRFAPDGTLLGTFIENPGHSPAQHQAPYGLGVDPRNGDVYLADTDKRGIDKYSADGEFILSFGTAGQGVGRFQYPSRVAVASDGRVFVADTWANEIVVHDEEGTELYSFGTFGTGPGQVKQPHGIAFDDQDRLYVVDTNNHRVQVFAAAGTPLFSFGSQGRSPGQFAGDMRGIALDNTNHWVYVVDGEGNKIHKFTTDGSFLARWGSEGEGLGEFHDGGREIAVDHEGKIWVGDMPNFRAQVFDAGGQALFEVGGEHPSPAGFNTPRDAAVDARGHVFVSDTYNWRIVHLDQDGVPVGTWGRRGRAPSEFNYTRNIAVSPMNSMVVVADTDNHRIKAYTPDGEFAWEVGGRGSAAGQFRNPIGIDINTEGKIAVVDTNNDRVQILDDEGAPVLTFGSTGADGGHFGYPRGIAFAPDETLWVSDTGHNSVQHFAGDGSFIQEIGRAGTGAAILKAPHDVEVTSDYVIVSDAGDHRVKFYALDGTYLTSVGGYGLALGQLRKPSGLDVADGRLYVTELTGERISVFDLSNTVDATPPDTTITTPAPGQELVGPELVLAGTATDEQGVASVEVALRNRTTGQWYHGGQSWGGYRRMQTDLAASGDATPLEWSMSLDIPDGSYGVHAVATDLAGNVDPDLDWVTFTVTTANTGSDTTPPVAGLDLEQDAIVDVGSLTLGGDVTEDSGQAAVKIGVQDRDTRLWLQPDGGWGGYTQLEAQTTPPQDGQLRWSITTSIPLGDYGVAVQAWDAAGNESNRIWRRFSARQ